MAEITLAASIGMSIGLALILGILLLVAIGSFQVYHDYGDSGSYLRGGIVALIGALILGGGGYPLIWWAHSNYEKAYKADYHNLVMNITSLDRDTGVTGHFVLGCGFGGGSISDRPVYYFYAEVKPNTYQLKNFHEDDHNIYVVETADYIPSIYQVKDANTSPNAYYYNIYVPFDSVRKTFSV